MSKKKGAASSRNGRDSDAQRLGVKVTTGTERARRHDHRAPARHQVPPGRERRPGQRRHPVRHRRTASSGSATAGAASSSTSSRCSTARTCADGSIGAGTPRVAGAALRRLIAMSSVRRRGRRSTCAAATAAPARCRSAGRRTSRRAGPTAATAGKGGDVILRADRNVASLLAFRDHPHRRAASGKHGVGQQAARRRAATISSSPCPRARRCKTRDGDAARRPRAVTATATSPRTAVAAVAATPGSCRTRAERRASPSRVSTARSTGSGSRSS